MKFVSLIGLVATLLLGCVSLGVDELESLPILPSVQDDPVNKLVKLSYTNDTGGKLCVSAANWPSAGGIVDNSGDEFYLLVRGTRYYLGAESDYCPGCGTEIPAGERIDGVLHYSSFDLPIELYGDPKMLVFTPVAWLCPNGLK